MKGRQSHGDLMAVLPFPTANGVGPGPGIGLPKAAPPKPNPPASKVSWVPGCVSTADMLTRLMRS